MTTVRVSLVLVSHSGNLARGAAEVSAEMAPGVTIAAAGGTAENTIGTSYPRVREQVSNLREAGFDVLLLSDIGSAAMVADMVAEEFGEGVRHAEAPFVEGAVAAAVAAHGGADLHTVAAAASEAGAQFTPPTSVGAPASAAEPAEDELVETLVLRNTLGLHARPAAMVARIAAAYDAKVLLNDTDASSVLALMGLALPGGAEVELRASGRQAKEALMALVPHFEEGFGEE